MLVPATRSRLHFAGPPSVAATPVATLVNWPSIAASNRLLLVDVDGWKRNIKNFVSLLNEFLLRKKEFYISNKMVIIRAIKTRYFVKNK